MFGRRERRGERVRPRRRLGMRHCRPRRAHEILQRQIGRGVDVIGIGPHDAVHEPFAHQRLDLRPHLLATNRHRGAAVLHVVPQLLGAVHRVHRHHSGVGAQNGVVADHELRAVLQVEQHAVALLHATTLLEVRGQRADLGVQTRIAEVTPVVMDRGLVRVALRADLQVEIEAGARHRQRLGQPGGPYGVVAGEHARPRTS